MKNYFLLSFLFIYFISFSQKPNDIDNNFSLKINPLALIDAYGSSSYRLGFESKLYHNITFSAEYGRYFGIKGLEIRENSKGYIFKPEIKWYLNKNNLATGNFVSLEYFYKDIAFDWKDTIPTVNNPEEVKDYRISKNIYGFTVKAGVLKVYPSHFIFEWYFGLGVRVSNGYNSLTMDERNSIVANDENEIDRAQKDTNYVLPNFSLGFKLGYSFY
jgi:Protein of unknown function (DUF3575)